LTYNLRRAYIEGASRYLRTTRGDAVKRLAAVAGVVAACAFGGSVATSAAKTVGACPTGAGATWTLVDAREFFGLPADFDTTLVPGLDQNNDGLTCVREITRFPLEERNNFLYRDNTV
jgi:hypothetical protein